ncbi:MAG: response regulator [Lachnospiraceae bacterium]|nr:response regulator [Lachnospiraceae bacterium]
MRAICVDDEELVLSLTVSLCEELPEISDVRGFQSVQEVLFYLEANEVDLVLLDIDMPEMNGIALAMKIKQMQPDAAIIFLTGYAQYAVDAFALHASGYLLKPVNRERLATEVAYAFARQKEKKRVHVEARTFGEFDLFVDGKPVMFTRAKAKELLAYLIDRQGASVSRKQVFAVLWEDLVYDRSRQKYLDVIIRSLRETLAEYQVEDLVQLEKGMLRICPEKLECDAYRFFQGDVEAINAYRGEYMSAYPWASMSEAYLDHAKGIY